MTAVNHCKYIPSMIYMRFHAPLYSWTNPNEPHKSTFKNYYSTTKTMFYVTAAP